MSGKFKIAKPAAPAAAVPASTEAIAQFAAGADARREEHAVAALPWEGKRHDKPTEMVNLRLTERQKAQLDFIAANAGVRSAQAWLMSIVGPALEEAAGKLARKE